MNERGLRALPDWALLTGILVLGLLPALLARDLWSSDELRYAEVGREMARYGHLLVPHLNGEVYAEKPPMFFWLSGLLGTLVRDFSVGGRLTGWLATAWTTLVVVRLGLRLGQDPRRTWLAGLIYLTFPAVFERGQEALLDPLLAAWALTAVWTTAEALAAETRPRAVLWALGTWLALAGGCLTKGPVVLLFPWAAALAFWVRRPQWRRGVALLGVASAAAVLCTVGWVALASAQVGSWYWDTLIFRQTAGRVGQATAAHREPFHFYLAQLPVKTLPWTLLVPGLIVRTREADAEARGRAWRLLAWLGVGLGVLSCVGSKRFGYALPLLAPYALALAEALPLAPSAPGSLAHRLLDLPLRVARKGARVALVVLALACAGLVAAQVLAGWTPPSVGELDVPAFLGAARGLAWLTWSAALALLVAWLLGPEWLGEPGEPHADAIALGLSTALCASLAFGVFAAARDPQESLAEFARAVRQEVPDPSRLRLLGYHHDGRFNLYLEVEHLRVVTHAELEVLCRRGGDPGLLLTSDQTWAAVSPASQAQFEVQVERTLGRRRWLLLR